MGETLWASMMQGHASQLKWHHSVHSSDEDETKENSTPTASSVKQSQSSAHQHRAAEGLDLMVGIIECQRDVQEWLLEEHIQRMRTIVSHMKHMSEQCQPCLQSCVKVCYSSILLHYYCLFNGKMNSKLTCKIK